MARKFRITEEQYNQLINEVDIVSPSADTSAIKDTYNKARESGVKPQDINIQVSGSTIQQNEGKVISMKTLKENRLKALKENSDIVSFRDFVRMTRK